jgi:GxxExxY protein
MATKLVKTPLDHLTYRIIGCAMAVHQELGPTLREDSYQRALANKLADSTIDFEEQSLFAVYEDPKQQRLIGYNIPDFVVEGSVIVEIKVLRGLDNSHLAQVIGYLGISRCSQGLLINFGERSLAYKRIFPPRKMMDGLVNRQWLFVPDWLREENNP